MKLNLLFIICPEEVCYDKPYIRVRMKVRERLTDLTLVVCIFPLRGHQFPRQGQFVHQRTHDIIAALQRFLFGERKHLVYFLFPASFGASK